MEILIFLLTILSVISIGVSLVMKGKKYENRVYVYRITLGIIFVTGSIFSLYTYPDSEVIESISLWGLFGFLYFGILCFWFLHKNRMHPFFIMCGGMVVFFIISSISSYLEMGILTVTDFHMPFLEVWVLFFIIIALIKKLEIVKKMMIGLGVFYVVHALLEGIIYGSSFFSGVVIAVVFLVIGALIGGLLLFFYKKQMIQVDKEIN